MSTQNSETSHEIPQKMKKFRISLIGDTAWLSFAEIIALTLGLLSQVILTRGLSSEEYGLWIVVFDAMLTIFLILDPGITTVIGRELPSNHHSSFDFLLSLMKIQIYSSIALIVFLFFLFETYGSLSEFSIIATLLISTGAFSTALSSPPKAILRSTGKASWEAVMRVIDRALLASCYVLIYNHNGSLIDYCMALAICPSLSAFIIYSLAIVHTLRLRTTNFKSTPIEYNPKIILSRSLPFFIFISLIQILERADKIILYLNYPADYVSTYGIALLVYFTGMAVTRIIRNVLLPWFSECEPSSPDILSDRYKISFVFVCSIIPLGTIIAQLVMMTVPIAVFPDDYIYPDHDLFSSESIFRILLIGWSIQMLVSPSWESIRSHSPPMYLNKCTAFGALNGIIFGIIFIPQLGVYGAAGITIVAPLSFLFACHVYMPNEISSRLEKRYFRSLTLILILSCSPLVFFLDRVSPIQGFMFLIFTSSISLLVTHRYWAGLEKGELF